jgi:hypothetical protein
MSYGRAKLAVDQYAEDRKKADYVREIVKEMRELHKDVNEDSLIAAFIGAGIGALAGEGGEDIYAGFKFGGAAGKIASYHHRDVDDAIASIMEYDEDFQLKFNQESFEDNLWELQNTWDDIWQTEKDALAWDVMISLYQYGEMGGYDTTENMYDLYKQDGSPIKVGERFTTNLQDFFGVNTSVDFTSAGFDSEKEYMDWIQSQIELGYEPHQFLTASEYRNVYGGGKGGGITKLILPGLMDEFSL